jgi:hypothetical protein
MSVLFQLLRPSRTEKCKNVAPNAFKLESNYRRIGGIPEVNGFSGHKGLYYGQGNP